MISPPAPITAICVSGSSSPLSICSAEALIERARVVTGRDRRTARSPEERRISSTVRLYGNALEAPGNTDHEGAAVADICKLPCRRLELAKGDVGPVNALVKQVADCRLPEEVRRRRHFAQSARPRSADQQDHSLATRKTFPHAWMHGDVDERILDCRHDRTFSFGHCEINSLLITIGRNWVQNSARFSAGKVNALCVAQTCCTAQISALYNEHLTYEAITHAEAKGAQTNG